MMWKCVILIIFKLKMHPNANIKKTWANVIKVKWRIFGLIAEQILFTDDIFNVKSKICTVIEQVFFFTNYYCNLENHVK